jgi:CDP-diacylglycerol pyrophosphatase
MGGYSRVQQSARKPIQRRKRSCVTPTIRKQFDAVQGTGQKRKMRAAQTLVQERYLANRLTRSEGNIGLGGFSRDVRTAVDRVI